VNKKFKNTHIESFMSGVIGAIFSTPCTAPFIGGAVAFCNNC
jgi:thiol:disulfide interchange protein